MAKTYNSFSFLNVQPIQSLNFPSVLFSNCKHTPPPPPSWYQGIGGRVPVFWVCPGLLGMDTCPSWWLGILLWGPMSLSSQVFWWYDYWESRIWLLLRYSCPHPLILTSSFFWLTGSCQHSCIPRPGYEATSLIPPNFMVRDESGDVDIGQITPGLPRKGRNLDFTWNATGSQ